MKNIAIAIIVSLVVGVGVGYVAHGGSGGQGKLGGLYETNPSHFANGLYAGQTDQFSVDASGNIIQSSASVSALGNVIQNAGIQLISTSTTLSGLQFCQSGMVVIPSTVTTNITLTMPSLATLATSPCAANIYSGAWSQQMIVNQSSYFVTEAANGAGESLVFDNGTSGVLAPGHTWVNYGQFVNTSVKPGATASGTTLQISVVDTQSGTAVNSSSTPASLSNGWVGHLTLPTGGTTINASTSAVSSTNSVVTFNQELTSPIAGVTCNSTIATGTAATILYNASTTLSGFQIKAREAPVTNPYCFQYHVIN